MHFSLTAQPPARQRADCLVLPIHASRELPPAAAAVDKASRGQLAEWLQTSPLEGNASQPAITFYGLRGVATTRVVLVPLGAREKLDVAAFLKAMRKAAEAVLASGAASAAVHLDGIAIEGGDDGLALRLCVETFAAQGYRFDEAKSKEHRDSPPKLRKLQSKETRSASEGVRSGQRTRCRLANRLAVRRHVP